jgi:gliding motility-associated-like protein
MTPTTFKRVLSVLFFTCFFQQLTAQYSVNGHANQTSCNEYTLTPNAGTQSGSVWNNIKIDLTQSFDFNFEVYLGNNDAGADGIAFVLQPISTSVGTSGGGLGYQGISPAVGVTIDTWSNADNNDPVFDHIAIQLNGDIIHTSANNIAGPVQAIAGIDNIEDDRWHAFRITWDATTKRFSAYIDGTLRVTVVKDFVTDVFGGNPMVFWGFTGSTGGASNLQRFRIALRPDFKFLPGQTFCINQPITFVDTTISFTPIAKFYWDFGDGSPLDSVNRSPVHTYPVGGNYPVTLRVIGADGCIAVHQKIVIVGTKPVAGFKTNDNCVAYPITFTDTSTVAVGTINNWYWDLGDGTTAALHTFTKTYAAPGDKLIRHAVKTMQGCVSDTVQVLLHVYSVPTPSFTYTDSVCIGAPMYFSSTSTPNGDPINVWRWSFSDSTGIQLTPNAVHYFTKPGLNNVILAVGANGTTSCLGIITKDVFVVDKPKAWFRNNTICQSAQTLLTDSSYSTDNVPINQWWWQLNGGINGTQNTITTTYNTSGTDTVKLVVHNSKGCASDTLKKVIAINAKPVAKFGISNSLCDGAVINFTDSSGAVSQWSWIYNYAEWSNQTNTSKIFTAGNQSVGLVIYNPAGCKSDTTYNTFYVNALPNVTMSFKDACKFAPVNFTAVDNSGTVTQWKWEFGDGAVANTQNATHTYNANGTYKVKLFAAASTGCYDGKLERDITIYGTNAFAGNDTIAAAGQPVQLHATGGLNYIWSPANLLNDATSATPLATLQSTQTFTLKAFTPEGCESYDDVTVKIYKGPDIYLPNAFTPNGDGLNDIFRGIPVGLQQLDYIKVFNRWGQLIFNTADYRKGWDGNWLGQKQPGGVYVVIAAGTDYTGKAITKKATIMLIR